MRRGEVVELEIPSAPEYVAVVRQAVEGLAKRMKFSTTQVEDLKLAVGEATTNAIRHGCADPVSGHVIVRCTVRDDGMEIEVRNDISDCPMPSVPEVPDVTKEGGLGLYIMQQLVDNVDLHFDDAIATVRLTKLLH